MDKNQKKALLRAWEEKQKKSYLLKKADAQRLFGYLQQCLEQAPCDHTLCHTLEWLRKKYPDRDNLVDQIVQEIQEEGGYCDCEVILNCYDRYEPE